MSCYFAKYERHEFGQIGGSLEQFFRSRLTSLAVPAILLPSWHARWSLYHCLVFAARSGTDKEETAEKVILQE